MTQPKISSQSLVRYLATPRPAQRAQILREQQSKLGTSYFAPYYQTAITAIREYHRGSTSALTDAIQQLQLTVEQARQRLKAAEANDRKKIRNEIARLENNIRVCNDYRSHFADRKLRYQRHRYQPLTVNGVRISGDFTIAGELTEPRRQTECAILVETHAEPPSDDSAAYELELLFALAGAEKAALPPRGLQIWHASSGKIWTMKRPSTTRWKDIEQACREIASMWGREGTV